MNAFEAKGVRLKLGNSHQGLIRGLRARACVRACMCVSLSSPEGGISPILSSARIPLLFQCSLHSYSNALPCVK